MKILYVTTIGATMNFFKSFIRTLLDEGHTIDIACNTAESPVPECYIEWNCKVYPLSCTRSALDKNNFSAVKEIRKIVEEGSYDLVHCHTPIAAACTRIACRPLRKKGLRVFYTAHGFHFYKGAPLKNWLLYYPVEWLCAYWTDVLITINKEDYARAKKHMHAKRVEYVPGVGIDTKKFQCGLIDKEEKRAELGLGEADVMILSVGELSRRKNHEQVIRAIAQLQNSLIQYFICGTGELQEHLQKIAEDIGVAGQVHFLGYRTDISELCQAADLFVFPSRQEGLPVALMEAIACRTPVICSDIRGNADLVKQDEDRFPLDDAAALADGMRRLLNGRDDVGARTAVCRNMEHSVDLNYENLSEFDLEQAAEEMNRVYGVGGGIRLLWKQRLRTALHISSTAFIMLSVGELNENKNHGTVIRALAALKNRQIHYCIAGTGALKDTLLAQARELGVEDQVHLLGYRNDIPELMQCADAYVLPSVREGLNVSLMEAMASGLPCICSDIRGNRDLIDEGKGGYLVKLKDIEGMKKTINLLYQGKERLESYSRFNREKIKLYSMPFVIERIKKLYLD